MSVSGRRQWLARLGAVLILAGVGTALYNLWPDISFRTGQVDESWPYPSNIAPPETEPIADSVPEGVRVVIPSIGVDVPVLEGDPDAALEAGVYRHTETAVPGDGLNVSIAGHRVARAFALLTYLVPGDVVILYWHGVEHDYRVTRVYEVGADDSSVLSRGSAEQLTLYTCTPRFLGNLRTVVVAKPVAD
ncbi:MAG: sortase [Coriobacteriia bacterium]|nr:sortase [Coriobacteriia bacterium]